MNSRWIKAAVVLAGAAMLALSLRHDLALWFLRHGVEQLRSGEEVRALIALRRASSLGGDADVLGYNLGVIHYRNREYELARSHFDTATAASPPLGLAARYNRGNALYRLAEQRMEKDPEAAAGLMLLAMADYRAVLEDMPGDQDASHNLEMLQARWAAITSDRKGREEAGDAPLGSASAGAEKSQPDKAPPGKAEAGSKQESGRSARQAGEEHSAHFPARSPRELPRAEVDRLLNEARGRERPAGELHGGGGLGRSAKPEKDW